MSNGIIWADGNNSYGAQVETNHGTYQFVAIHGDEQPVRQYFAADGDPRFRADGKVMALGFSEESPREPITIDNREEFRHVVAAWAEYVNSSSRINLWPFVGSTRAADYLD